MHIAHTHTPKIDLSYSLFENLVYIDDCENSVVHKKYLNCMYQNSSTIFQTVSNNVVRFDDACIQAKLSVIFTLNCKLYFALVFGLWISEIVNCFKALSNIVFVFQFKTNCPIFNEVRLEVFKLQSSFFGCLYYGHSIGLIGNFTPTQTEARFTNNFRLRRILEHVVVKKFYRNATKSLSSSQWSPFKWAIAAVDALVLKYGCMHNLKQRQKQNKVLCTKILVYHFNNSSDNKCIYSGSINLVNSKFCSN